MYRILIVICLLALLAAGCATPRNLFVLLPDPDGSVGRVVVENPQGSQELTQARQATGMDRSDQAPKKPFLVEKKNIMKIFGAALEALPQPPVSFILYFKSGTTKLTKASLKQIPDILATVKKRRSTFISIIGHCDRVGSWEFNLKLSTNRAMSVAEIIMGQGVSRESIEVTFHGEENPLIETPDDVPEARNRRVEVTIR